MGESQSCLPLLAYHLKRNLTTVTYYGTEMKPGAGESLCDRLSASL